MPVSLSISPGYTIPQAALRRWATQRLQRLVRPDGGIVYRFALSGSTCTNVPIETIMTVAVAADGRIESATAQAVPGNRGCNAMCVAPGHGDSFLAANAGCDDVVGLTLEQAAFRDWREEPSGCFCTEGNRRHKWRNVFQTLHYAVNHVDHEAFRADG